MRNVAAIIIALVFVAGPSLAAVIRYHLIDKRRERDMARMQQVVDSKVYREVTRPERLEAVEDATSHIDDPRLNHLAQIIAQTMKVPMAMVTLVKGDQQCFLAASDTGDLGEAQPLSESWCRYVVATKKPVEIDNALVDPLVRNSETVKEKGIRAYLGVPVRNKGEIIGSVCALDTQPREWTDDDYRLLFDFAKLAETVLAA